MEKENNLDRTYSCEIQILYIFNNDRINERKKEKKEKFNGGATMFDRISKTRRGRTKILLTGRSGFWVCQLFGTKHGNAHGNIV